MENATRLFDCMDTQAKAPRANFLNAKENGAWKSYSTKEAHDLIYQLSAALLIWAFRPVMVPPKGATKLG
jgi:long-chain acyl-CoA synthetase